MYINSTGFYVPSTKVPNEHFLDVNGLTNEWIEQRTGIKSRFKATEGENHNTMGLHAIDAAITTLPYDIHDVDLIVSASYTPFDTVATLAHIAQRQYGINGAKAIYLSTACVSFFNGLEVIEGYFAMGKAHRALLVCSEHNTYYSNEKDPITGHLWGDAAVAYFLSPEPVADTDATIHSIYTCGLGNVGKGPEGVRLRPHEDGIAMPFGRDVFMYACRYLLKALEHVTSPLGIAITDLDYIICHQANKRIILNVAHQLGVTPNMFLSNIETYGNTGAAGAPLVLAQNMYNYKKGTRFGVTGFGGGYACGAFLVEK